MLEHPLTQPFDESTGGFAGTLLDALEALVVVLDRDGRIVRFNRACEQTTGYTAAEVVGRRVWEFLLPEADVVAVRSVFEALRSGGFPSRHENWWLTRAGEPRRIVWSNSAIVDDAGAVRYVIGTGIDVTGWRRTEEELTALAAREQAVRQRSAADARLRAVLDAAPDGIVVVDESGRIAHANPQLERAFGYEPDELLGQPVERLIPLRLRDGHRRHRAEYAAAPATRLMGQGLELVAVRKDGSEVPVEISLSSADTADGRLVVAIVRDVSERRRMETALRESERRFRAIFDHTYQFIGLLAPDGRLLEANQTALDFAGVPAEDVIGRPFWETAWWQTQADRERLRAAVGRAAAGEFVRFEAQHQGAGDAVAIVDFSLKPVRDEAGRVVLLIPEGRDITERKRAELTLAQNEKAIRSLYEVTTAPGLSFAEKVGALLAMGCERFDVPIGILARVEGERYEVAAVHAPPGILSVGEVFALADTYCVETLRAQQPVAFEQASASPWRTHPCYERFRLESYLAAPVRVGEVVYGTLNFSSLAPRSEPFSPAEKEMLQLMATWIGSEIERLHTHERLTRLTTELRHSNAELEQFAYVASHDLQEPLRTIAGFTSLLQRRYAKRLDDDADEFIGYVVDGVKRMQRLIDDLLTYSRIGARRPDPGPVDTGVLVDEIVKDFAATITDNGATVTVGALPVVVADRSRLRQVFQNLIGNALKFCDAAAPDVHIHSETSDACWTFSVRDNGIGIAPEHGQRIFQIFSRLHTRDEYPGTGIGLAICKKVVEQHGGEIWVESTPGEGSTFSFTLPTQPAAARAVAAE
jgi:PAS domain S-box-containing protein